jgi:hypothetical protein
MSKQDGGQAYPSWQEQFQDKTKIQFDKGMSFRDRAAVAAMQGFLSNSNYVEHVGNQIIGIVEDDDRFEDIFNQSISRSAYNIADAMVAEKERRDNGDSS